MLVEFAEEGGLGITFVECEGLEDGQSEPTAGQLARLVIIGKVLPDSMAAQHGGLRPGMVLHSVQGAPVADDQGFRATMARIKTAGRPIVLGFATVRRATDDGVSPCWEPRLVPLKRLVSRQTNCSSQLQQPSRTLDDGDEQQAEGQSQCQDEFGFTIGGYFSPRTHAKTLEISRHYLNATKRTRSRIAQKWKQLEMRASLPHGPELAALARRGLPRGVRQSLWVQLSVAGHKRAEQQDHSDYYAEMVCRSARLSASEGMLSNALEDLEKDLDRTFPGHPLFSGDGPGQLAMRRMLGAYAFRNDSVGYCQSMNFVAAALLLVFSANGAGEEDSFWVLTAIVEDILPEYYTHSMRALKADADSLGVLIDTCLPDVAQLMNSLGVVPHMLCVEWFLKVFVTVLPFETVLRVWDCLLLAPAEQGGTLLLAVAVTILTAGRRKLLRSNTALEFMVAVRICCAETIDADTLLKRAYDKKLLNRVRKTRTSKLKDVGVLICAAPHDIMTSHLGETISVPDTPATSRLEDDILIRANSSAVDLPRLEILPAESSTHEPSTAPSQLQPQTMPLWNTESGNCERCGVLQPCGSAAPGSGAEEKWFVLRRGLEPFYPPQLQIFCQKSDVDSSKAATVLELDKTIAVTVRDVFCRTASEGSTKFELEGWWNMAVLEAAGLTVAHANPLELNNDRVKPRLVLDAGTLDSKQRWIDAIAHVLDPMSRAGDHRFSGRRQRSLSWQGSLSRAQAMASQVPSPVPSPPPSPVGLSLPERSQAVSPARTHDCMCDESPTSLTRSSRPTTVLPPLQYSHRVHPCSTLSHDLDQGLRTLSAPHDEQQDTHSSRRTCNLSAGHSHRKRSATRLLQAGEIFLQTQTNNNGLNFIWGGSAGMRWESHWLVLVAGIEPWFGPELQVLGNAPKPNHPPPALLAAVPLDALDLDALQLDDTNATKAKDSPKHAFQLRILEPCKVRGPVTELLCCPNGSSNQHTDWVLLDTKSARAKACWKHEILTAAATAAEDSDTNTRSDCGHTCTTAQADYASTPVAGSVQATDPEPLLTITKSPLMISDAEGYLELLLLNTVRKTWTKRWVMLCSSQARLLHYVDEPSSTVSEQPHKPSGEIDLSTCVGVKVRDTMAPNETAGGLRAKVCEMELRFANGKIQRMRREGGRDATCEQWLVAIGKVVVRASIGAAPVETWGKVAAAAVC